MMKQLIALSLVVLLGSHFFGNSIMNALAGETEGPAVDKYYTSIEIQKGDSLWSIAGTYLENSGMTTAQYVKELKNINGLKEDTIHSGQYLTVMYFATDSDSGVR
ncbi:LysM peptidoglycan-binding domain-containing protein [Lacrimispora sp.]|uniref:LysM peptidoglycan-binding domain-containing protein n=1 Tax=Lacrimispora sp. TaxID=2719234 RepID=UPI0028B0D24C|nr:LysM peptidoglycan-binding domain-containing protein [Lacrimispora sp.]